ncbi:unnamed protein product [Plutella xylostella]|uniref:(diamondback moth) hypothetical protein n=1 Tax=Plutella xylostella TaxID=51655 RepID=A0A8S4FTS5_PLUXY|nr:unnamed protein product [Plutella xylostella]
MALKTAGQFPRRLETSLLWDMLDWDPWHLRAQDLNEDMLRQLQMMQIEDLDAPGDAYIGFGQHNPLLTNTRLGEISYEKKDLGELMLSLCYLPTAGRLTATVIKGRNLKAMDINGSSDPYVKICLICQGKRIKKKKTTVKKNTLNPVYNEALVFDLPQENVHDVTLLVKVIDYDRIGPNELIGCTAIGSTLIGIGRDHWLEMLDNPRKPVAQWYPLNKSPPTNVTLPASDQQNAGFSCLNGR